jgi:hypothetical protein
MLHYSCTSSWRLYYFEVTIIIVIKALIQEIKKTPVIKEDTFEQGDIIYSLRPALLND